MNALHLKKKWRYMVDFPTCMNSFYSFESVPKKSSTCTVRLNSIVQKIPEKQLCTVLEL